MDRIKLVIDNLDAARGYTNALLDQVPESKWFIQPQEGVTHIGWQVGHLAVAQFALALVRVRGKRPDDDQLVTPEFLAQFDRTSVPEPDPALNPSVQEIRSCFDRIHQRVIEETSELDDSVLDELSDAEHRMFNDKFGALCWCAQHEFIHAGQIGLIRRLLGDGFAW